MERQTFILNGNESCHFRIDGFDVPGTTRVCFRYLIPQLGLYLLYIVYISGNRGFEVGQSTASLILGDVQYEQRIYIVNKKKSSLKWIPVWKRWI